MEIPRTPRHRAAIKRNKLSSPCAIAINKRIITPDQQILDYHCGRGDNMRLLNAAGYTCDGYDPNYKPVSFLQPSYDVVMLLFVLGTIVSPRERREILEKAWFYTSKYLLISTQVQHSRGHIPCGDGYLTSWATFQKYWTEPEFKKYIEGITKSKAKRLGKGIIILKKS